MQLKVIKADGIKEDYMHTKILRTINTVLAESGKADMYTAEQLTEAITFYLYHQRKIATITSGELHSIIVSVLDGTGHEQAALQAKEYQLRRNIQRRRLAVVDRDIENINQAIMFEHSFELDETLTWNKSCITAYLLANLEIDTSSARAISSAVEEKILKLQISCIPTGIIKQLALMEAVKVMKASSVLTMQPTATHSSEDTEIPEKSENIISDREVWLRQPQDGLCLAEQAAAT